MDGGNATDFEEVHDVMQHWMIAVLVEVLFSKKMPE
jgi:hypothetical protein